MGPHANGVHVDGEATKGCALHGAAASAAPPSLVGSTAERRTPAPGSTPVPRQKRQRSAVYGPGNPDIRNRSGFSEADTGAPFATACQMLLFVLNGIIVPTNPCSRCGQIACPRSGSRDRTSEGNCGKRNVDVPSPSPYRVPMTLKRSRKLALDTSAPLQSSQPSSDISFFGALSAALRIGLVIPFGRMIKGADGAAATFGDIPIAAERPMMIRSLRFMCNRSIWVRPVCGFLGEFVRCICGRAWGTCICK